MGYCLSCGKLRDLIGGMCEQCRIDRAVTMRKPKPKAKPGEGGRRGKP